MDDRIGHRISRSLDRIQVIKKEKEKDIIPISFHFISSNNKNEAYNPFPTDALPFIFYFPQTNMAQMLLLTSIYPIANWEEFWKLTSRALWDSLSTQMMAWSEVMLQDKTKCSNLPSTGTAVFTIGGIFPILQTEYEMQDRNLLIT